MLNNNPRSLISVKLSFSLFMMTSLAAVAQPLAENAKQLSLTQAIKSAQKYDPWLAGSRHQQSAVDTASIAANTLPAPKVSLGLANFPTNGFEINQEAMTQIKFGVAQVFPRGDSLKLKSQQLKLESESYPYQRLDRAAKVAVTVGSLWLDAFRVQQSLSLVRQNQALFQQLVAVVEARYSSALGETRQQDLIRVQLELSRLEERLVQLKQEKSNYDGMLSQWLRHLSIDPSEVAATNNLHNLSWHDIKLSQQLPVIDLLSHQLVYGENWLKPQTLVKSFYAHPSVMAIDKKINATKTGIALAKQKYKPEWGVNASYGYRANDALGASRADLFSVGVTFDLPIFTKQRQDNEVRSAISTTEAIKTEKLLLLKQLLGAYSSAKGRLLALKKRQNLYQTKLLVQTHEQAEALLTAYTNDDGDFSELVRARIALLNTDIDYLALTVEEQKIHLELNYLFIGDVNKVVANNSASTDSVNLDEMLSGEQNEQ